MTTCSSGPEKGIGSGEGTDQMIVVPLALAAKAIEMFGRDRVRVDPSISNKMTYFVYDSKSGRVLGIT